MEAFFGYLESMLSTVPLQSRRLCILASRKLLGQTDDQAFMDSYATILIELEAAAVPGGNYMRILDMCIEAYGRASAASAEETRLGA